MRALKVALLAGSFLLAPGLLARAGVDIDAMNKQIDQTNVLVGAGGSDFCSGTVISIKHRLILTAEHCVADQVTHVQQEFVDPVTGEVTTKTVEKKLDMEVAQRITKNFEVVGAHRYVAKIKGRNHTNDVALLQVVDEAYAATAEALLAPDAYKLKRGQDIWVIGNPSIEFDNSLTKGIVSATERTLDFGNGDKVKVFQIDAAAIGGNSGGSVVNENGELVGTLDAGIRGAGINFVVPISAAKELLRSNGFRDVLGEVALQPVKSKGLDEAGDAPVKPIKKGVGPMSGKADYDDWGVAPMGDGGTVFKPVHLDAREGWGGHIEHLDAREGWRDVIARLLKAFR